MAPDVFVAALDAAARDALLACLSLCLKCHEKPGESLSGETKVCCRDCYMVETDRGRRDRCGDCPMRKSLGKCFAGACAVPAVRYANGHALCDQHASDVDRRQAEVLAAFGGHL